jgi:hypothetical protein
MICPQCSNEWDASKSPCPRCGFIVRMTTRPEQNMYSSQLQRRTVQPDPPFSFPQGGQFSQERSKDINASFQRSQSGNLVPGNNQLRSTPRPVRLAPSLASPTLQNTNLIPEAETATSRSDFPSLPADIALSQSEPSQLDWTGTNGLSAKRAALPGAPTAFTSQASPSTPRPPSLPSAPRQGAGAASFSREAPELTRSDSPVVQKFDMSQSLLPGVLLRGGRYRLQEVGERQEWSHEAFEVAWMGRDFRRGGALVSIREVVVPENSSLMMQGLLRAATLSLVSVGRHPRVPALWDAFSDRGRGFFVFETINGNSLQERLHHLGRPLVEQEALELFSQICEVLELLGQQSPPLVHGLIRPEHIYLTYQSSPEYILGNFSPIIVGGALQFINGIDSTQTQPYVAPEFGQSVIDVRSDLYSLAATVYYAVTGTLPQHMGGKLLPARQVNPSLSAEFSAVLTKCLQMAPGQRYQNATEVRRALQEMRSISGRLSLPTSDVGLANLSYNENRASQQLFSSVPQSLPTLPIPLQEQEFEEDDLLLPSPETLPAMREGNDRLISVFMLLALFLGLTLITVLSQFNF